MLSATRRNRASQARPPPRMSSDSDAGMATPSTVAEPFAFTTNSLKKLQSTDGRKLLDVVDKLRRTGLNGTIELPQLVVCGDQSSGKSSVLEAITEIPFPRKAGLCTRFATEIVLRRQPTSSLTVKINPSKTRSQEEQKKLSLFGKTITDLSELPEVIQDATTEMGLGKVGESAAFSRDILSVEISGPDRPQLTLVDLPGLIHSATKAQSEADKELIFDLVQEYMKNPRTIILAVVSAKNDAANQIILSLFKKIDIKGSRTLGIITKPDCMSAGDEQFWFDLAANKEVFLQRGWHMVKNRSEDASHTSFAERNNAEQAFFETGRFKDLPRTSVGIESLRDRLSTLLHRHLVLELPSLKLEMKAKLKTTKAELEGLGEPRSTTQEQKVLVTKISQDINLILRDAVHGSYRHHFFGSVDMKAPITEGSNVRRLRAVIQELNRGFAEDMQLRGIKYKRKGSKVGTEDVLGQDSGDIEVEAVQDKEEDEDEDGASLNEDSESDDALSEPREMTQAKLIDWVKNVMLRCRGQELPGSVNPEVTSHLFWELSEPWKALAEHHVEQIGSMCQAFFQHVLEYVAPSEFKKPLEELVVNAVLEDALKDAQLELCKLLRDKARHPSTYNHYYTDNIQKRREEKYKAFTKQAHEKALYNTRGASGQNLKMDIALFQLEMLKSHQQDMVKFTAEETLESSCAYYKDEMKYFVHAVTKQVIERCMIEPLADRILSPKVVLDLTDEEIAYIAAEPPETLAQRAFLEERKQMLEKGFAIFEEAMGSKKRSKARR
ncbi:P-loop containing nucleoside triphosphate hydrolase protein [Phaeosphaeria sp. MPI-PUGE-AT-0046c]|nr:P-loop containing nucleoside triphosphate hydrolase protein [Phaeosphaeria sp. MPI-PUGE-AT-0046c]